jgi:hypothetical protein
MNRELVFTDTAAEQYAQLQSDPARKGVFKQVRKTLAILETDTRHPSLRTHEYSSLKGANGERVWEAYAQQNTPAAYRVFFHYGPDEHEKGKQVPIITIVAITRHP